jgi:hypothetical protein
MITKLTKEQESLLQTYKDKYLKIGLSTDRFDFETAKEISDYYYEKIVEKKRVPVVIMDSPYSAWLAVCMLLNAENKVWNQVRNQVNDQVNDQIWNQVRNQIFKQVSNQVSNQVFSQVWNQVSDQVSNQVCDQVRNQVFKQVSNQIWNQVRNQVKNQVKYYIHPYIDGHLYSSFFGFYDFMNEVLNIEFDCKEKYDWYKKTIQIGNFYPLENICIVSQKPIEINMMDGKLHADGKPSVVYGDGFSVWSLNGIMVTKELAETPAGLLNLDIFKNEKNADVKTEFIRKCGIDRMIDMGKVVDSYEKYDNQLWNESEYKLIDMASIFDTIHYAPHLYMKNQTTGAYHLEGVSPDCKNLVDAFKFREYENFNQYDTIFVK